MDIVKMKIVKLVKQHLEAEGWDEEECNNIISALPESRRPDGTFPSYNKFVLESGRRPRPRGVKITPKLKAELEWWSKHMEGE